MTTSNDKDRLRFLLSQRCELMSLSQAKAAKLAGINEGALSAVLNGRYQSDDTAIWKKLAIWLDYRSSDWENAETKNQQRINTLLLEAKMHSQSFALVAPSGSGKSHSLRLFATSNKAVVYVVCGEHMNRIDFVREILNQLGKDHRNMTITEMLNLAIKTMLAMDYPMLILDEADKLTDSVFIFYITLFNQLEDNCALVIAATDHLVHRIERGIKYNKKGYAEIHSRIGRVPIELPKTTAKDIELVCAANGVTDPNTVARIIQKSDGDIRRVKRECHIIKTKEIRENDAIAL